MAEPIFIAVTIWESIVACTAILLFVFSLKRYQEKKSGIALKLAIAFLFFALAVVFQVIGELGNIYEIVIGDESWSGADPNWFINWMLNLLKNYQFAYFFLVLGLLMIYRFAMDLGKITIVNTRNDHIALFFAVVIICFGLIKRQFPLSSDAGEIATLLYTVDIYVIVYALFMIIPILKQSKFLLTRIEDNTSIDYKRIRFMFLMGISLMIMTLCFILETIWGIAIVPGEYKNPISFLGFGFAMISILFAYYSFYSK